MESSATWLYCPLLYSALSLPTASADLTYAQSLLPRWLWDILCVHMRVALDNIGVSQAHLIPYGGGHIPQRVQNRWLNDARMGADLTNLLGIIPNIARDRALNNAQVVFAVDVAAQLYLSGGPVHGQGSPSDVAGLLRS